MQGLSWVRSRFPVEELTMSSSSAETEPDRCVVAGCDAAARRTRLAIGGQVTPGRAKCDSGHRLVWTDEAGWQPIDSWRGTFGADVNSPDN